MTASQNPSQGGKHLLVDYMVKATKVPQDGLERTLSVGEAERLQIADRMAVLSVDALDVHFTLQRKTRRHFILKGTIKATLTQGCVVTLDPIQQSFEESFKVSLKEERDGPPSSTQKLNAQEIGALDLDPEEEEIETFSGDELVVGELILQFMALAIDPYPRSNGTDFSYAEDDDPADLSPFASLKVLKPGGDQN